MYGHWLNHAPQENENKWVEIGSKVLEDNSTFFIRQNLDHDKMAIPWAPQAELNSFFAVQPRKDFINAVTVLALVNDEEGVNVIREVFTTRKTKSKTSEEENSKFLTHPKPG